MVAWGLPPAGEGRVSDQCALETAAQKPTFRDAFASRRCLSLPADGMNGPPKRPWHVQLATEGDGHGRPAAAAGNEDRFVIMTSAANGELTASTIASPCAATDSWDRWLAGSQQDAAELCVAAPARRSTGIGWGRPSDGWRKIIPNLLHRWMTRTAAENQPATRRKTKTRHRATCSARSDIGDCDLAHLDGIEMPEHKRASSAIRTPCLAQYLHLLGGWPDIQ